MNSPVKKIIWKHSSLDSPMAIPHVQVKLDSDITLYAEHVIFTPSLAVLKSNYSNLFHPSLPLRKIQAIKVGVDL